VAEFREPRDKARQRAKPVIDRLGNRRQQLLGLGLLPLPHFLFVVFDGGRRRVNRCQMLQEKKARTEAPDMRTVPSLARTIQALRTIRGRHARALDSRQLRLR
jgi:hypothetical protein